MNEMPPELASDELAQLGKSKFVFCTRRKTLVWGFLVASFLCLIGIGVLVFLLQTVIANWPNHVLSNCAFFLPVAGLVLWGGIVVGTKTNRKRRVRVVVNSGGIYYRSENSIVIFRWDQISVVRLRRWHHHDEGAAMIAGVPIVASADFDTHSLAVQMKDGVEFVFTDELQNLVGLAKVIEQELERSTS